MRMHEITESAGLIPTFVYHVTSDVRLQRIRKQGLVPQICRDAEDYGPPRCASYLGDWQTCLEHAEIVDDRLGGNLVYFRVKIVDLDLGALEPDDYDIQGFMPGGYLADPRLSRFQHWSQVPWELSLAVCGACAYTKTIPYPLLQRVAPR